MERARRLANRAILRRLVSEAKQHQKNESVLHSSTTPMLLYSSSRCMSSVLRSRGSKTETLLGRNINMSRGVVVAAAGGFLGVGSPES